MFDTSPPFYDFKNLPPLNEINTLLEEDYSYISWISNISGRLFFHLTNGFNFRNDRIVGDVIHYNKKSDDNRFIFISMLADLRDYYNVNTAAFVRIILIARTSKEDSKKYLVGHFYIIADKEYNFLYKRKHEQALIQQINKDLKKNEIANVESNIEKYIEENKSIQIIRDIEFKVKENGLVFLKKDPHISNDESNYALIKIAFYFLKFTFHKDRFHKVSAEEIIRVLPLKKDFLMISEKLILGIKRYISETRKNYSHNPVEINNLLGVANYGKSLIRILYKDKYINQDQYQNELNAFDSTMFSLNQELEKKPYRVPNIYQFFSDFQITSLILLSTIAPMMIIYSKDFSNKLNFINDFFIPSYVCGYMAVMILVFTISMMYNRTMYATYLGNIIGYTLFVFHKLKKISNPNLSNNIITKYVIPFFIRSEMVLRRSNIQKILFLVLLPISISFLIWKVNSNYELNCLFNSPKAQHTVEEGNITNKNIYDINKTLLEINEKIGSTNSNMQQFSRELNIIPQQIRSFKK